MLDLTDDLIFAEGGRRVCYMHPHDPGKCVKILGPNGDPHKRRREAPWYKRIRPLAMFDDNRRELKSFKVLERYGEAVWNHFPRCYGITSTNVGDGIVTDLVRNADAGIPLTVREYIKKVGKTLELRDALEFFFGFLRQHRVVTRDILDHNIIVQTTGNGLRIIMIDGFGSSEAFPLSSWIPVLGAMKVERKIRRFKRQYDLF